MDRILIAEDEVIISEDLRLRLEKMGYEVSGTARSAEQAFEFIEHNPPDIVLMDIMLAGNLDGIEASRVIRERYNLPVIFLTSYEDDERLDRAKKTIPYGYIIKPFRDRDLKAALETGLYAAKVNARRHRAEEALRESEERYRELVQNANSAIIGIDARGNIKFFNHYALEFFGYAAEEIIGRPVIGSILPLEDAGDGGRLGPAADLVQNPDLYLNEEKENRRKNGQRVWMAWTNRVIRDAEGRAVEILAVGNDVTERKTARAALRAERDRAQQYLDTADIMILGLNTQAEITLINRKGCDILGYEEQELLGRNWMENFLPDRTRPEVRRFFLALLSGEYEAFEYYESPVLNRRGEERIILWHNAVLTDETGAVSGTLSSGEDVTERRAAEEALRQSEARLNSIFRAAPIGIGLVTGCVCVFANDWLCEMTGYDRDELQGRTIQFLRTDGRPFLQTSGERSAPGPELETNTAEVKWRRRDGREIDVLLSWTPLNPDEPEAGATFTALDVTAAKKNRAEQQKLSALVENSQDFIGLADLEGRVLYINEAGRRLVGIDSPVETRNMLIYDFVPPDRVEVINGLTLPRIMDKGSWHDEGVMRHFQTGETIPIDILVFLVRDPLNEEPLCLAAVARDMRERAKSKAEREALENQLRQAQKMEAIGTLAGGIAHDFNNILGAIIGYTELSLLDLKKPSPLRHNLVQSLKAAARARELVNQILTFSRQAEQELSPIRVAPLIKESLAFLRSSLPTTIEIRQEYRTPEAAVMADPIQIQQVLINLCTNAAHAMKQNGGLLRIVVDRIEFEDHFTADNSVLVSGEYLHLTVADTGTGIAPDVLDRIFDPYFTTKEVGEGTGMGLAMVQGIVQSHKGGLKVESEPGRGTVFHVYLPLIPESRAAPVESEEPLPRGTESILCVDDEGALVDVARKMLVRLGYNVRTCTDSLEALSVFNVDPNRFDLILTDQTMPKMTGLDLAAELRRARPDLPVILCTGFSGAITQEKLKAAGVRACLGKPLVIRDLALSVRAALDDKPEGKAPV